MNGNWTGSRSQRGVSGPPANNSMQLMALCAAAEDVRLAADMGAA